MHYGRAVAVAIAVVGLAALGHEKVTVDVGVGKVGSARRDRSYSEAI